MYPGRTFVGTGMIGLILFLAWLARRRPPKPGAPITLRPPRALLLYGLFETVPPIVAALAILAIERSLIGLLIALGIASFGVMGVATLAKYYLNWIRLTDSGIIVRTTFTSPVSVHWRDISEIRAARWLHRFLLHLRDGKVVRLSAGFVGFRILAAQLLEQAVAARIEPAARARLEEFAKSPKFARQDEFMS